MARLLAIFVGLFLAGALAESALAAGLRSETAYRSHPVAGTTPSALWQFMRAHPIIDPDDGPALANLTHDHDLTFATRAAGGLCRVEGLEFRWHFVLTLPRATDFGRMTAANRSLWTSFVASLRRHEETHRAIFLDCGRAFVAAAAKLTDAACPGLDRKVRAFVDQRYAACMARQKAFEAKDRAHIAALPFIRAARGR